MLEAIADVVIKEVERSINSVVKAVQKRVLRFVLKVFFCVAGLTALAIGLILMGSKYVGLDLMLVAAGVVLIVAFFLS